MNHSLTYINHQLVRINHQLTCNNHSLTCNNRQLARINYQLTGINYQLTGINYQLTRISTNLNQILIAFFISVSNGIIFLLYKYKSNMTTTLNSEQARLLERSQNVEQFCNKNSDKYAILKPFQTQVDLLAAKNKKINSLIPARSTSGEAATGEKRDLKIEIAASINTICSLVIPYAQQIGDGELYNAVNYTTTDVIHLRGVAVLGFVTTLTGVIAPLLSNPDFADYPVTADDLDALNKNAVTYNDSLGTAKMIEKDSSIASANIDAALKDTGVIIGKMNKLINYFQSSDPDFVEAYRKAAIINKTGIHHSGIGGVIINSTTEQPIKKASVIIAGKKKSKTTHTDSNGAWQFNKFMPGECTLTISAPGYESQTVTATISRGKMSKLNISLQSQVVQLVTA